jgi:hypothetical protein
LPQVIRAPQAFVATAEISGAVRQAAVLPFSGRAPEQGPTRPPAPPLVSTPPAPVPIPALGVRPPSLSDVLAASSVAPMPADQARAEAPALRPVSPPEPRPAPRPEAREALELLWFDPDSVPRFRRNPPWRALLDAAEKGSGDPDFDDPALASEPAVVEDRREVFEILTRGEPADLAALEASFSACQREDGRFVPSLLLVWGVLETPFDELATLQATLGTVTPFLGNDEPLRVAVETARELLALPDLMASPAIAEGLTRRIDQAFAQSKRAVSPEYLDAQRERVLLEQRRYQRRAVLGEKHLRALLRFDGADPGQPGAPRAKPAPQTVPVYLPEATATLLPLSPRLRIRLLGEIRLATDPSEAHPAALRALALGRAVPAIRR